MRTNDLFRVLFSRLPIFSFSKMNLRDLIRSNGELRPAHSRPNSTPGRRRSPAKIRPKSCSLSCCEPAFVSSSRPHFSISWPLRSSDSGLKLITVIMAAGECFSQKIYSKYSPKKEQIRAKIPEKLITELHKKKRKPIFYPVWHMVSNNPIRTIAKFEPQRNSGCGVG